jgi:hypothetical protein
LQKLWARGDLLAWTLGAVQPIGDHEQAENNEHDEKDVFDFHDESLVAKRVG